jgi:hypothetical protein
MRNTIFIALIFTVIQINVHATLGTGAGDKLLQGSGDLVADMGHSVEWVRDANLVQTMCDTNHPLLASFDPTLVEHGTGRTMADICAQEGRMNWYEAKAWIRHLNANTYLGYTNWRLPEVSHGDSSCSELAEIDDATVSFGYGCRNSEPGRLHAMLGSYIDHFVNLDEHLYWAETELAANPSLAGVFGVKANWQDVEAKTSDLLHVWPVHSL